VDITEFAPRSVKSELDFHEILAEDNPDVWKSNRPVSGGETGALLKDIILKAAELKSGRGAAGVRSSPAKSKRTRSDDAADGKMRVKKGRAGAKPSKRSSRS
jgi:hypothetical protein